MDHNNDDKMHSEVSAGAPQEASKVVTRMIEDEMRQSYLDYAMSVIIGRALPDVRDGLKPVHRRILYAMNDMGMQHNKPYKKCARIVGEVLGKYHPHGDSAVYDTLVRMAQDFSLRYTLVDGQGNFGSIDGDYAAAMRYTEARLAKISEEMLLDIDKETVNFVDNFDGTLQEPTVLPARLPNLLINGSSGIAVGMATNIPPHNLSEVCKAIIEVIDNPDADIKELLSIVQGPDFPTGGLITGKDGILNAYKHGTGKVIVRGKTNIEKGRTKDAIIITEIPYQVNKSAMIEEIVHCVNEKIITDISDIRDESGKEGIRIVIELKKDANPDIVVNQLYKHSSLQTTFGINMLALVDNQPKVLNLKELIINFIKHRRTIVIKRTEFELKKALEREHILEGLTIALDNLDKVIADIRRSKSVETAREALVRGYSLTEIQANAILDMKLQKLTSLEQNKIRDEKLELEKNIQDLREILDSEIRVMSIIKAEIIDIQSRYGDARKTEIIDRYEEIDVEDLIADEQVVVTITHSGYIKRTLLSEYKTQRRGGKGVIAAATKEADFVQDMYVAGTHDVMLFFTTQGNVHWLKVYQIPEAGRYSQGKAIVNLLQLKGSDKISASIPVKVFDDSHYLVMATKKGIVKKTVLSAYGNPRQGGIKAINLDDGDNLVNVVMTDGKQKLLMATRSGMAIRFDETDARPIGRASRGVTGINLSENDEVIGMVIALNTILTVTENGYGKRSDVEEYRLISRGGKGVINIQCSERNGGVVAIMSVGDEDEIMLISKNGIIIRTRCKDISVIGRNTQGLRLMKLEEGDKLVAACRIADNSMN